MSTGTLHSSFVVDLQSIQNTALATAVPYASTPAADQPAVVPTWEARGGGVALETGNVAIGFEEPTANRLDVAGTVNAQGFTQGGVPIVSSPWVGPTAATAAITHSGDVGVTGEVVATGRVVANEFVLQSGEVVPTTVYDAGTNLRLTNGGKTFELAQTLGSSVRWSGQPIEDAFIMSAHKWAEHEARLDLIEGGTIGSPWDLDANDGALVYTGQVRVTGTIAADGFTLGGVPMAAPSELTALLARVTALETELTNTRATMQNNYAQLVHLTDVVDTLTGAE